MKNKRFSVLVALFNGIIVMSISASCTLGALKPEGNITNYDGYYTTDKFSIDNQRINNSVYRYTTNPIGNQKILVVPVHCSTGPTWTDTRLSRLESAFFGESEETAWESVSSFYSKSSYGRLNLTGEVYSVFEVSFTPSQIGLYDGLYSNQVGIDFHKLLSAKDPQTLRNYDVDKDGYVDAVAFIYSNSAVNSAFWAWVGWNTDVRPSKNIPGLNNYMWASYNFMDGVTSDTRPVADTYIHETGHLLGLDDYYHRVSSSPKPIYDYSPLGGLDMMDQSISDHNAYSKMLLGWTYPYVIDGSKNQTTIAIKPFESSGDVIIIPSEWNGAALDEYLMIEYYTPTGLNEYHATYTPVGVEKNRGFTKSGVKILHVDARVAELGYSSTKQDYVFKRFIASKPNYSGANYLPAASNISAWSVLDNKEYKLVHLMEAGGVNTFRTSNAKASNGSLFVEGDTFTASDVFFFNNDKFNNGKEVGYSISIGEMNAAGVTIVITKL